jgi:hypothetical protein
MREKRVYFKELEPDMTVHDYEVLRILDGQDVPGWTWGAAMGICCEWLCKKGYAKPGYDITVNGVHFLNRTHQ